MTALRQRFAIYHAKNPHVYEMFKKFAFAASAEKDTYSADAVLHRMRWYTEIETRGDRFKINNNYAAYYGRLFMNEFPQHKGFFRTRLLAAQRAPMLPGLYRTPLQIKQEGLSEAPIG